MACSEILSSQHPFPNKRSLPTQDTCLPSKRCRLEYILSDPGHSSLFSVPLDSLPNKKPRHSNLDARSELSVVPSGLDDIPTDLDVPHSPSDHPNHDDPTLDSAPLRSPHSPSSTHLLPAHLLDKFTKSRAVGQSHRDNEKEHVKALRVDVEKCRHENVLLFALFSASYKLEHCKPLPLRLISDVRSRLEQDRREDYGILTDHEASRRGFVKLSNHSAHLLEQRYMSPALAVVLLDFVMFRRNFVAVATDINASGYRRRKRRSGFRIALSTANAREVIDYAVDLFIREERGQEGVHSYVDRRLASLTVLMDRWARSEANNNPPEAFDDDEDATDSPPKSPTRPEAAEFGSPARRRGEGAKRCSRCNMVKFTGSGHGRSKCDDGYSISSRVPYRPVLSSPVSECTSPESSLLSH